MPDQLPLRYDGRGFYDAAWGELLGHFNQTVVAVGLKEAAFDLDVSPSALSHALNERERHYVRAQWVPYLIHRAPTDDAIACLAKLRGLTVARHEPLTAEEKLQRLERALGEHLGSELRSVLIREAYKR